MKRYLLILAALALAALSFPSTANATCGAGSGTCFVVVAGGNSSATTTWSASSGGITCTCVPAATDAVILDNLAGQLTISAALSVASIDASGTGGSGSPYTGTLTHNAFVLTIGGNLFKLVAGMTYAPNSARQITFTSTSGTTLITSAGKTLPQVSFNGVGGTFQLQDNLSANNSQTLTSGTLDLNGKTITQLAEFIGTGSTTRVLNCGVGGGITLTGLTSTLLDVSGTGITTDGNCIITLSSITATGSRALNLGTSLTFAGVVISQAAAASFPAISITATTPTITTMTLNGPLWLQPSSTTYTVGTFNIVGTSGNQVMLSSAVSNGTGPTFNVTTAVMTWAGFMDITFGTSAVSPTNCFAFGNNSFNGGTCAAPSGGGGRIIGG
jgi:hypothetical protein